MSVNFEELSSEILELVGGKDNILAVTHCVTRLRLSVKDQGLIKQEEIKKLKGIMGCQFSNGQFQIIVGQNVPQLSEEFCKLTGIKQGKVIEENLDTNIVKEKFTVKKLFSNAINGLSACIFPIIPIFVAAGIIKMLVTIIGPNMLNIAAADSDIIALLSFVGDAGFYFMPIFVAWAASKKFNTSTPVAIFLGAILIHPTLLAMVSEGAAFTVYGIPMTLVTYTSQLLPSILTVWILSYVHRFVDNYCPESLKYVLAPLADILIMLPIMLCILGPLGTLVGQVIASASVWLSNTIGPLAIGLIGGLWYLLVGLGMDKALVPVVLNQFATFGYDNLFWLSAVVATYSLIGVGLAFLLKCKKEDKSTAASSAVTLLLGGVSEPTIFGCIFRFKKAMLSLFAGGFAGGVAASILGVKAHTIGAGNAFFFTVFAGGDGSSFIPGIISCAIALVVGFTLAYILGFEDKKEVAHK